MANPTTNYSFAMPTNTDLVKDLPADFEIFGQAVDTQLKNLSPGTTAGDVDYYTSSTAKARVGIGTAGQVLTVNSGATAPEWATPASGGMTLISTTTLSGASTTLSSIPQTYNSLFLIISGMTANTADDQFFCALNNVSNLADYSYVDGGSASSVTGSKIQLDINYTLRTSANNCWVLQIDNYTSATAFKPFQYYGRYLNPASAIKPIIAGGTFSSTTAITSIVFNYGGGTFSAGTVLLYGVK
jgi:hypothetical protein